MKLLFDQNLSLKLVGRLADLFPGSLHVEAVGLDFAVDETVWEYALAKDLVIVSKDEDYSDLSVLRGSPPKVVWLQIGNCTTQEVEDVFRARFTEIEAFGSDPALGVLALGSD